MPVEFHIVLHVTGQHDGGAVDIVESQATSYKQSLYVEADFFDLILEITMWREIWVDGHHAGEVEVIADFYAFGICQMFVLHLCDGFWFGLQRHRSPLVVEMKVYKRQVKLQ